MKGGVGCLGKLEGAEYIGTNNTTSIYRVNNTTGYSYYSKSNYVLEDHSCDFISATYEPSWGINASCTGEKEICDRIVLSYRYPE